MTHTPEEIKKGLEWDEVDNALQKVRFDDADDDDIRRPKTSVDIKKGLHHCSKEGCGGCPYEEDCFETDEPFSDLAKDSFALIQQLQAENAEKDARIQQLEAERDAAVKDMCYAVSHPHTAGVCYACKHHDACQFQDDCDIMDNNHWEWRGVQKEETK